MQNQLFIYSYNVIYFVSTNTSRYIASVIDFKTIAVILHFPDILSNAKPISGKGVLPAEENEFPFFVVLSNSPNIDDHDDYFCGGTLITQRHVITSMHCLDDEEYNDITLIVNAASKQNRRVHQIYSWIAYDGWALDQNSLIDAVDNDIAIITVISKILINLSFFFISKTFFYNSVQQFNLLKFSFANELVHLLYPD